MPRTRLFAKRASANGNSTASAPPAPPPAPQAPPPDLSLQGLQRELADTRQRVHALAAERETLALRSLEGDADARARIEEIDAIRLQLVSLDETYNAAIRSLGQQQKREHGHDWRKRLPHLRKCLTIELATAWAGVRDEIGLLLHGGRDPRVGLAALDDFELKVARKVATEQLPPLLTPYGSSNALIEEADRLKAERASLIQEVAQELLASVDLKRPDSLAKMIAAAHDRVQARKEEMAEQMKARTGFRVDPHVVTDRRKDE